MLLAKDGKPIQMGEKVWCRARGGKQEGVVEAIFLNQDEIDKAGNLGVSVKHPPKVSSGINSFFCQLTGSL